MISAVCITECAVKTEVFKWTGVWRGHVGVCRKNGSSLDEARSGSGTDGMERLADYTVRTAVFLVLLG